jgi:hypothetical protein
MAVVIHVHESFNQALSKVHINLFLSSKGIHDQLRILSIFRGHVLSQEIIILNISANLIFSLDEINSLLEISSNHNTQFSKSNSVVNQSELLNQSLLLS